MNASPITTLNRIPQIAIAGVGLLGGSIGLALKKAGYTGRILGIGRRESSLQTALEQGCIDAAAIISAETWQFSVPTLVILATPISQFEQHLIDLGRAQAASNVPIHITDAGSTKAQVCQWANEHLARPECFLGAHPMAGSEKQGPTHAQAELLSGRPCLLTPCHRTSHDSRQIIEALWQAVGMRLVTMDAAHHDATVAAVSHLPHAVAMLLVLNASRHPGALDVAAGGFRDTTRVASGDVAVWKDIFMTNRQALIDMIDELTQDLAGFRSQLQQADEAAITQSLADAKRIRDDWAASPVQGGSLLPSSPQE